MQHANSCTELQPHLDGVCTRRLPVHISRYHQTSLQFHSPSTGQEGGRGTSNTPLCNRREREREKEGGRGTSNTPLCNRREREREQEGGRGTSNTPLCNRREKESRRVGGALVGRAKRAPHWGVQSRFRVIYIYVSVVVQNAHAELRGQTRACSRSVWGD